jgi:hypothetical protein
MDHEGGLAGGAGVVEVVTADGADFRISAGGEEGEGGIARLIDRGQAFRGVDGHLIPVMPVAHADGFLVMGVEEGQQRGCVLGR